MILVRYPILCFIYSGNFLCWTDAIIWNGWRGSFHQNLELILTKFRFLILPKTSIRTKPRSGVPLRTKAFPTPLYPATFLQGIYFHHLCSQGLKILPGIKSGYLEMEMLKVCWWTVKSVDSMIMICLILVLWLELFAYIWGGFFCISPVFQLLLFNRVCSLQLCLWRSVMLLPSQLVLWTILGHWIKCCIWGLQAMFTLWMNWLRFGKWRLGKSSRKFIYRRKKSLRSFKVWYCWCSKNFGWYSLIRQKAYWLTRSASTLSWLINTEWTWPCLSWVLVGKNSTRMSNKL